MQITRTAVINDLHIPWHDPKAVSLTLDVIQDINVDRIIINGDLLDFYNINAHGPKHPDAQEALEDELYQGKEFLTGLRKRFTNQHLVFLFGNHENRLDRYILNKCPAFWNLVRLDKQLGLKLLDVEWYDYNYEYRLENTNLFVQHSPPSYSENLAMTSLKKKLDHSAIYGCSHRMDFACKTGKQGVYEVWANGWLGSTDLSKGHSRVFSYAKGHQNWQQCFSIVNVIDGKEFQVQQIPIRKSKNKYWCIVDGFYYEG